MTKKQFSHPERAEKPRDPRPRKSLGQNFLRSKHVLVDIAEAAELSSTDTVLEVGPGKGVLTTELLGRAGNVIAVEKDDRLIPLLQEKFSLEISSGKLTLIHGDILQISASELLVANKNTTTNYKLVANIPYYITGELLRKFLSNEPRPTLAVLMLQKEVVSRIVAKNSKESLLSLSVKAYGVPRLIRSVSRTFFSPAPKVDSAILKIEHISSAFFETQEDQKRFFDILHAGFGSKRKKLSSNLKKVFGKSAGDAFGVCGLDLNIRAEDLALGEWKCLLENY